MTDNEFTVLVKMMRNAQKHYFRTRDPLMLQESKRIERLVDNELLIMAQGEKLI